MLDFKGGDEAACNTEEPSVRGCGGGTRSVRVRVSGGWRVSGAAAGPEGGAEGSGGQDNNSQSGLRDQADVQ